jgi:geranylgeranyl diphosphate synthase type II
MHDLIRYRDAFVRALELAVPHSEPAGLYEPVKYILNLGGKRIRPLLTLMSAEVFGANISRALPAAMAVELFHNFSLIHDDIMDGAPLRRGKETVHTKWDLNTGILSGDAMLILAYQYFESYEPQTFQVLAKLFSKTALQVCEGQQYDVEFELRDQVSIDEYLLMIEYKTAVLLGAALQMGAIVAGSSIENQQSIYDFGRLLGIAFQLQDDYLDSFGDPETFGKQVGGDIIENKKTFLYLKALEFSTTAQRNELAALYASNNPQKVHQVKALFELTGATHATLKEVAHFTDLAFKTLETLSIGSKEQALFRAFGESLMNRTN